METILDRYGKETLRKVDLVLQHAERYANWDGWDIVLDEYEIDQIAELVKRTRTDKGAILKVMADVRPLIPAEKLAEQEAKLAAKKANRERKADEATAAEVAEMLSEMKQKYEAEKAEQEADESLAAEPLEFLEPTDEEIEFLEAGADDDAADAAGDDE